MLARKLMNNLPAMRICLAHYSLGTKSHSTGLCSHCNCYLFFSNQNCMFLVESCLSLCFFSPLRRPSSKIPALQCVLRLLNTFGKSVIPRIVVLIRGLSSSPVLVYHSMLLLAAFARKRGIIYNFIRTKSRCFCRTRQRRRR